LPISIAALFLFRRHGVAHALRRLVHRLAGVLCAWSIERPAFPAGPSRLQASERETVPRRRKALSSRAPGVEAPAHFALGVDPILDLAAGLESRAPSP